MEIKRFPFLLSKPFGKREPKHGQKWKRRRVFVLHISLSLSPSLIAPKISFSPKALSQIFFSVFRKIKQGRGIRTGRITKASPPPPVQAGRQNKGNSPCFLGRNGMWENGGGGDERIFSASFQEDLRGGREISPLLFCTHAKLMICQKGGDIKKQTFPLQGSGGLCQRHFASHFFPAS